MTSSGLGTRIYLNFKIGKGEEIFKTLNLKTEVNPELFLIETRIPFQAAVLQGQQGPAQPQHSVTAHGVFGISELTGAFYCPKREEQH